MPDLTVTQTLAFKIRLKLEYLASDLEGHPFQNKLRRSTLSSSKIDEYMQMWRWCNQDYMHYHPNYRNMVATGRAYLEALHYKHKFRPN